MKIIINEQQLKNLVKDILSEQKGEEIYNKFYSDIDKNLFIKIISADPTSKINNGVIDFIGRGGKWLIDLYRKGKLERYDEDLPKATDYLEIYYKYKNKFKDISYFDSLPNLYNSVRYYFDEPEFDLTYALNNIDKSEYKKVYEDNKWNVYQVLTEKAACYLGVNTEWCTTYGENSLNKRFKDKTNQFYNYEDNLFILINKNDENDKYQFHVESEQFMDKNDKQIDIRKFWQDNPDLSDFFVPFFEDEIEKLNGELFDDYDLDVFFTKIPPKALESFMPEIIEEMNRRIQEFEDNGLDGKLGLNYSPIKELPKHWVEVKGSLYLEGTPITNLGNLKSVGRSLTLRNTQITSLGNLESVGGYLSLSNTPITSLGNLKSVGGDLWLRHTPITSLGNLESVGGNLYLVNTQITSLGNLEYVEGYIFIEDSALAKKYSIDELEEMYPQFKGKFRL